MTERRTPERVWQDFDLVQEAAAYAAKAHRGDLRKGDAVPYVAHLWSVAALVLEHGGDDEQTAAALLHDVVEDHGGQSRLDEVRERFGPDVAAMVEGLSDSLADTTTGEAKLPWRPRKEAYLAHLADADPRTALVSACDKLHNARCILADLRQIGDRLWGRFNNTNPQDHVWYYRSLIAALTPKIPTPLADELSRTVDAFAALVTVSSTTAEDRAIGALLGLAAGDAVGTTLEFKAPGSFTPITDMVGDGPFRLAPGEWTDDTSMALCLAESILDRGELDLADQLRRYNLWRHDGYFSSTGKLFDIGITTQSQLARFERTGEPIDPRPDEEAAANGSLMRLAPVAIRWHADPAEAAEQAAESSRSTHPATRPVDACRVLGAMTAALISGTPAQDVLNPAFWQWGPLHPEVEAVARGSWRTKQPPQIRGTGYCVDALEAALWAVDGATDFAEAVLRAANLGNDADTTAAIAGQLAGARWGASGIRDDWKQKVVSARRITSLATHLFRTGEEKAEDGVQWANDPFHHAWLVEPGVYAGEYPASLDDASRSVEKLSLLIDAGIRTFIDLTTPEDRMQRYEPALLAAAAARNLDLRRLNVRIPDNDVVDHAEYDRILDLIDESRTRGDVYIHCWGGIGRTGTVVGCLLARQGHTYEAVMAMLVDLRKDTKKWDRECPQGNAQRDVLRHFTALDAGGPAHR
jgi:ADP-ribosylglycohydrolase/predicted protein tyrosine phosphatase